MPTITIPEDSYQKLADRAQKASLSVPDLLSTAIDELARTGTAHLPPQAISHEEWLRRMNVVSRTTDVPPDNRVDGDREGVSERAHIPTSTDQPPLTGEEWDRKFTEFNQTIQAEAAQYPDGFRLDHSREAMYEDRLRSQM